MAAPAFRAAAHGNCATSTTLVCNKPTGTLQNDVIYAFMSLPTGTAPTVTAPSGSWTLRQGRLADGTFGAWYLYELICGASEPSTYTWTFSTSQTGQIQ